ncbi:MAG: MBL fold metallo-hydrolase [Candidatus Aenigmatarchaeota archaeon]
MAEVKVLIEGYVREENKRFFASPATVLIVDNGVKVLVDPGANKEMLLSALSKEGMRPQDIDIVFLTHYHLDHSLNIGLFPDKDILDGDMIYRKDEEIVFSHRIPNTNIEVIQTPGHAHEHVSLMASTDKGKVCIAGDLFWWMDKHKQKTDTKSLLELKDPYEKDHEKLVESRKMILKQADWIIPGHGKPFRVSRTVQPKVEHHGKMFKVKE